ncbi:MAG: methyltransferase domain-containing protein [Actinomycetota bacterium]|nr:methyltransferase domain-containing protein [Actinomycetota bacterium]
MIWDPDRYLRYADLRTRPGLELISRIPDINPGAIVDLGAGTGNLTSVLASRWPDAEIAGIDSSPEMVERAGAEHDGIDWATADIESWKPTGQIDLIFSNAALHWIEGHQPLFGRLRSYLSPGGVLAVSMPDNWAAGTHSVPKTILDEGNWPQAARDALIRDRVGKPDDYRRWVQPADVDSWRTTYFQTLTGPDPVWTWVTGSLLRPVLAVLDDDECLRLERECKDAYREAYPPRDDGATTLPFSRLFLVARAR